MMSTTSSDGDENGGLLSVMHSGQPSKPSRTDDAKGEVSGGEILRKFWLFLVRQAVPVPWETIEHLLVKPM